MMEALVMKHDGNTYYRVHDPQFSQAELVRVFEVPHETLNNWVKWGFIKPARSGWQRMYSIMDAARAAIIAACVRDVGLRPWQASEIADFAAPFLAENLERHIDGELKSTANVTIVSRIDADGKVSSRPIFRRPNEKFVYADDPDANPEALPVWIDYAAVLVPASEIFASVHLKASALLAEQKRGGLDKFGRSIDAVTA
jgi:MerR HTH family regulatory protein